MAARSFDIKQAVIRRRDACAKFKDGSAAKDRREAMQFYRGTDLTLYGESGNGLSSVVSRDTMEAIESMMPPLLRPFVAGEQVVSFDPVEAADEEATKQATEYVNHVFRRDNNILMVVQTALKDGLLLREGIAKTVVEEDEAGAPEAYTGVSIDELRTIDPEQIAGEVVQEMDGTFSLTLAPAKSKRYRTHIISPRDFLREERVTSLTTGSFFGDSHEISVADLIALGVDEKKANTLQPGRPKSDEEDDDEHDYRDDTGEWASDDPARMVWVDECYIRCDYQGAGTLEWRKILLGGANNVILLDEPIDNHPYSHWTPVPIPHQLTGLGMWDLTRDVQMQKTALQREQLNNLYLVNRPQREILDGQVNIDDLLQPALNGHVRVRQMNSIRQLNTPFVASESFPMIEYLDGVREARTGVTRYNQGMDANSLNKTATGMSIISNNSQQRQELVARQFGEFLKDIFKKILVLAKANAAPEEVQQVLGDKRPFVGFPENYDMTVSVGLGTNNKDQTVGHIMNLLQIDKDIIALQQGIEGPIVTAANLYEKLKLLTEAMGFKGADRYYTDPTAQEEMGPPQPEEPPVDPLAGERMKQETELEKERMRQETELTKEQMRQEPVVVPINGMGF